MATKNLARTVLERGRTTPNKYQRGFAKRRERRQVRAYLIRALQDPDLCDEIPEPRRKRVDRDFADKVKPLYRWLDRQDGRLWNAVWKELTARFDRRTVKGRHLLNDHVRGFRGWWQYGAVEPEWGWSVARYGPLQGRLVDEQGILRTRCRRR